MKEMNEMDENEIIYSYTRKQAIADGVLIDVTELAKEAGFKCPVAFTSSVLREACEGPGRSRRYG
jgi:hypothetical protein